MRIVIVGNSGSGKSMLAAALASKYGLASFDLDTVAWEPGKIAVARDPADAARDLRAFCEANASWVIEGCYGELARAALAYSPLLLFLDPGVEACLENCRSRPWEPHKYASKREQDERLAFLLDWVRDYDVRDGDLSRAAHQSLFDDYEGRKRKLRTRVDPSDLEDLIGTTEA